MKKVLITIESSTGEIITAASDIIKAGDKVVYDCNGYKVVELHNPKSLVDNAKWLDFREKGQKRYQKSIAIGAIREYSVVGNDNKRHAYIEINMRAKAITNIYGKGGVLQSIDPKPLKCVVEFLNKNFHDFRILNSSGGYIVSNNGRFVIANDLPDDAVINQSCSMVVTKLPDNLTVNGDLSLVGSKIKSLPKGLTVRGELNLSSNKNITKLPDDIRFDGLWIPATGITSLDNVIKNGDKIKGDLVISDTKISSLPDNLEVRGNLDINNTKITSLPKGLHVHGELDISNTKIKSLPDDLRVKGTLILPKGLEGKINENAIKADNIVYLH